MKLLNILGAVIAVHIAVLVLAIVIPGCRSTKTAPVPESAPAPTSTMNSAGSSPISAAPVMRDADLNPPLAGEVGGNFDPNAPATSSTGTRFSPTRPSTPVATNLDPVTMPAAAPEPLMSTYTVQRGDNLWALAKKNRLTVRELASANGLPANAGLRVGQVLVIPGKAPAPVAAPLGGNAADPASAPSRSYVIRPGDTLGKIARAHGTSVAELKAFNRLSSDLVRAGDKLYIPESAKVAPAAATEVAAVATPDPTPVPAGTFKHTVAPGESLAVIASRYGVRIGDIALANKVSDPSLIRAGQQLIIPGWDAPPPAVAPATTTTTTPAPGASPLSQASEDDLDAGLDDEDLSDVPVLTVDEPVKTIGGGNQSPPVFD